jgi:hypothetical protein
MVCVGFRRAWAVAHIVVAAAGFVVAWPFDNWWQSAVLGAAVAALITGGYRLFRPYFEFDPAARTISMKVMPGVAPHRFGGTVASGMLRVSGRRIVCVRSNGRTRKVPVVRAMAEPAAWDAVVGALSER